MMLRTMMVGLALASSAMIGCGDEVDGTSGAGGNATGEATDGCDSGALEAGTHTVSVAHDNIQREYRLHLPPSYEPGTPLPLVLNFHGFTSNMDEQAAFSGMDFDADANGYAVAYPNGINNSWNGGALCCGTASSENVDDVGFARVVVDDIANQACIDKNRVYSTGMSNGGFMSHRLACEASDLVAAVAPVAGLLGIPPEECLPERPVPIIHFYGTEDSLVSYSFADVMNEHWLDRNGCTGEPTTTFQEGTVTCETHDQCEAGASVTICSAEGMGHCWPGQSYCPFGESTVDISANAAMWDLFQQHALP